jgi:ribosomal protein L12E/L44/L45/RPP1/RPP2
LTPEQNQLRKKKIDEAVKALQKTWTTPPATAPASGATAAATMPKGE